ncbi:MAG: 50S ribosomal protein L29 [Roseibacillus sp.]|tara:strand:+ start:600 stop:824 length:225 start_codon:yes stop_codon:yes gene_type:complete
MAQSTITEIRELSSEELQGRLRDLKQEGLNLRLQQATGQLENSARLCQVRREVARVMTVLNQRHQQAAAEQASN